MTTLLVTTGAESSGKTTLASQLAAALNAPLITEVARDYLGEKLSADPHYQYQQDDLLHIAQRQLAAEQAALLDADQWLVCDTDLLVILIWSQVKFGNCDPALQTLYQRSLQQPRIYLLCYPDMPWQADPLRENPHDRPMLHALYLQHLQQQQATFHSLQGNARERLVQTLALLNQDAVAASIVSA